MPTNIRAGLSVVVALLTLAVFYFESRTPAGLLPWLALGLGAFMLGVGRRPGGRRPAVPNVP